MTAQGASSSTSVERHKERVYFGSSQPEWFLYVGDVLSGYWSECHNGPLPKVYQTAPVSERRLEERFS